MTIDPTTEEAVRASLRRAAGDEPAGLPEITTLLDHRADIRCRRLRTGGTGIGLVAALLLAVILGPNLLKRQDTVVASGAPDPGPRDAGESRGFRPVVTFPGCTTVDRSERTILGAGEPMNAAASTQVLYLPSRPPPDGPLITLSVSPAKMPTDAPITGGTMSIDPPAPGQQGGATWSFSDGSEATAYARNVSDDDMVNLLKGLQRTGDPAAGFTLTSQRQTEGYVLVNIDSSVPSATLASSRCERTGGPPILISAVTGESPAVYAVLTGHTSAAAATAVRGSTLLFAVSGDPATDQAALANVHNAPTAEWSRYPEPSLAAQPTASTSPPTTAARRG